MIDENNIESYILAALDEELSVDQLQALTIYMEHHPEAQQMMEDYRKTIIAIDADLVYPNKSMLLKKETTFLQKMYIPLGIAAALVLIFLVTILFQNDEERTLSTDHSVIAVTKPRNNTTTLHPAPSAVKLNTSTVTSNIPTSSSVKNIPNHTSHRIAKKSSFVNHITNQIADSDPTNTNNEIIASSKIQPIALIPMQSQSFADNRLEYEVQITTAYIRLNTNNPSISTVDDEMDWNIASIPFQPSFSKIDNFIQKVAHKKEQLFDKIALLTPLEL